MSNNSGVTLVTLGIIIIVLMIISGMTIYSVSEAVNSAKKNAFTTELKIMQAQVNLLNEKMKNNEEITVDGTKYKGSGEEKGIKGIQEIGYEITGSYSKQADEAFKSAGVNETDRKKYRLYDVNIMKELAVEGVEQELLINVEDRKVISYKGMDYKGNKYYDLASLSEEIYNVEHQENNKKPTFKVEIAKVEESDEWQIKINDIQYEGYISKWKVKYKHEEDENWKTNDDIEFTVDKEGIYYIKLFNGDIESEEVTCEVINDEPSSVSEENNESPEPTETTQPTQNSEEETEENKINNTITAIESKD